MARVSSKKTRNSQPAPTRPSLHTRPSLLHPHALQLPPLDLLWYWWDCSLLQRHGFVLVEHRAACLHHQQCGAPSCSCDEMMERCTAYSTVASGASAEALIEKSRCLLATCCSGKRAIGAARQAVPLSLRRRAPPRWSAFALFGGAVRPSAARPLQLLNGTAVAAHNVDY